MAVNRDQMQLWSVKEAKDLYNVDNWGQGFFDVNEDGNVTVKPLGNDEVQINLPELAKDLRRRGISLPILLRFSDILRARIVQLNEAFAKAIGDYKYRGSYSGVYPIKVNQQRQVVEEILDYGVEYNYGLEAGSKPELLAVIALANNPQQLIICNGYKDNEYIDAVCMATKMGKTIIPVIEKFTEVETIIQRAKHWGVRPKLGVRVKLSSRGSGKWQESGGERSKFGLNITEILRLIETLRENDMLDCLQLLHFHIGSQITNIRAIKEAVSEAGRLYIELKQLGANMRYLDVGGGLAVDYDGSHSNFVSSSNYSLQEYANDVVAGTMDICEQAGVDHPIIVSESGRAITAHHSVLVFDVLGVHIFGDMEVPSEIPDDAPDVLHNLHEAYKNVGRKNYQEIFHDVQHARDQAISLFKLGFLDLKGRGMAENMVYATLQKILRIMRDPSVSYIPDELQGLEKALADTYFCNFSMFQSVPDFWMVQQLFPVMPIHRHNEEPSRRAILADITCDSDGKIDRFIDLHDVKQTLELHPPNDKDYCLGVFLLGAYQEILGDLHNLFGDTNAVHVRVNPETKDYEIEHYVMGDTVSEVLSYVQWQPDDLIRQLWKQAEVAVKQGRISLEESAKFVKRYEEGLRGYTYLTRSND